MAASTCMIKDKKPLEIIWNDYIHLDEAFSPGACLQAFSTPAPDEGRVVRTNEDLQMNSG